MELSMHINSAIFSFYFSLWPKRNNYGSLKIPRGEKYDAILKEMFCDNQRMKTFDIALKILSYLGFISGLNELRSQVFL